MHLYHQQASDTGAKPWAWDSDEGVEVEPKDQVHRRSGNWSEILSQTSPNWRTRLERLSCLLQPETSQSKVTQRHEGGVTNMGQAEEEEGPKDAAEV